MLNFLIEYFDKDKSSTIKNILVEKYEDLQDQKVIEGFEKEEKAGKISFVSADQILGAT